MSVENPGTITACLAAIGRGDQPSKERLWSAVYDELREMAAGLLAHEPVGLTLQPTALVHEVYARLIGGEKLNRPDRAYFFGAAAQAMRRILIEHARRHAPKRDHAGPATTPMESLTGPSAGLTAETLVALDEALDALAKLNRRVFDVIMLRFFAGLTIDKTAEALDISARTVGRHWTFGRTWLYRRMIGAGD